jgi:hypothetical protein
LSRWNHFARAAFGGWQLGGIMTAQTGSGLTIAAGQDYSKTGLNRDRGVLVPGQDVYGSTGCGTTPGCRPYLNKAAFAPPAAGTFGNLGKNALWGPGSFVVDANISKNFALSERCKLQFRGEFFNALNHVNPNEPNQSMNSADFGLIRGAGSPRTGQVALKLTF